MLKEIGINIPEGYSGIPGVFHDKSRIQISTNPEFEGELFVDETLTRDNDVDQTIFMYIVKLNFERTNSRFFIRTVVGLSNGVWETESRISVASRSGLSASYQFSDTIIKDPKVFKIDAGNTSGNRHKFETGKFMIYRGNGEHSHTSWRLLDEGKVVWERPRDPDHLLSITVDIDLDTNRSYTMEATHHIGDIDSNWGKHYFITGKKHEEIFHLQQNGEKKDVITIHPTQYNFIELKTRLMNVIGYDWVITLDNVIVLRSTTVPTEVINLDRNSIVISGYHLEVDKEYVLSVSLALTTHKVSRDYNFTIRPVNFLSKDFSSRISLNDIVVLEPTLANETHNIILDNEITIGLDNDRLCKYVRSGGYYQTLEMVTSEEIPHQSEYEKRIQFIQNKLVVQVVEEVQTDVNVVYKRKIHIYNFDPVNNEIFNPTSKVVYDAGYVYSTNQSFDIIHTNWNEIQLIVLDELDELKLVTINLNTATQVIGKEVFTIPNEFNIPVPMMTDLNGDLPYHLLVGKDKVSIINTITGIVSNITPVDSNLIDFSKWTDLIKRANGDIYLVGLDTRVLNEELLSFYKFRTDAMAFTLIRSKPCPSDSTSTILTRPNILVTKNNYIGVGYATTTFWLS